MQLRVFGRTGMQLSVLGFGCGAVGGFMVRGDPADRSVPSRERSPLA
jgi:aryl-alcohol dehydrogenase-like predicted oxidoreductase